MFTGGKLFVMGGGNLLALSGGNLLGTDGGKVLVIYNRLQFEYSPRMWG